MKFFVAREDPTCWGICCWHHRGWWAVSWSWLPCAGASRSCSRGCEAAARTLPPSPTCWTPPGSSSSCSLRVASGCNPGWLSSTSSCRSSLAGSSGPGVLKAVVNFPDIQRYSKNVATDFNHVLYFFDFLDFWVLVGGGGCRAVVNLFIVLEQPRDLPRRPPQKRPVISTHTLYSSHLLYQHVHKVTESPAAVNAVCTEKLTDLVVITCLVLLDQHLFTLFI